MFVNQPDDAQVVALWDDPETCPAIARRLGVSQTWLTLQWRRLRQQDRLPTDRRRNASERRVDESSDGADGRPTIKTRDRLFKRLIAPIEITPLSALATAESAVCGFDSCAPWRLRFPNPRRARIWSSS